MRRDASKTRVPKARYRVSNWAAYNAGLINRGNVTMWIDEAARACTPDSESRRGCPRLYGDALIQALPGLKSVFRLPPRAPRGCAPSLRDQAFATLPVPNYTTMCRRARTPEVQLTIVRDSAPIHLVVDSTGVRDYGEGEWKVHQHGYSRRRTWRKVHLALDANAGQLRAALMTHQDVAAGGVLAELLDQIPVDERPDVIDGDEPDDSRPYHATIAACGATPSIPPREDPLHESMNTSGATWRNDAVDAIAQLGRREWKKSSGYHRRSLAENAMSRFKTLTGNRRCGRRTDSQATKAAIRVCVLNRVADIARPQSGRIACDHDHEQYLLLALDLCNEAQQSR
ncbi:IS5 family transposase [Burkholderia mayonis]|uniref:IS5 family transposase n=1 Tax=Burkholderia mayonis TaxID=1385591 RepID=UPI0026CB24B4